MAHEAAVAVIGMAGRFPGASTPEEYWRIIRDGVDTFVPLTDEQLRASGVEEALLREPGYVRRAALLEGVELFDADFFGISPREAETLDPQHRFFLECAHEALERAGYSAERPRARVGVFASASTHGYYLTHLFGNTRLRQVMGDFQLSIANDKDFLPTRVSYKLGLRGPSVAVQTACSSSLVAVHMACQSLLNGECSLALAGGTSISVPQAEGYLYQEGGIASPDGYCRPFDAAAAGTNRGNGVGVVVLKLLEDALEDGDTILAVIRGSAVNNDGSHKVGYTAPSVEGQAAVISEALSVADVAADSIGYVEAHGTATPLGDPIEVEALTRAFRSQTQRRGFCALGSVKANIGHLDAAAGIAAFMKAVLVVHHGTLPPSPYFRAPNPRIAFDSSPFYVNVQPRPWASGGEPRRAGVSSFGIGGTNVHVVLEQPPPRPESEPASRPHHVLPLSARTESALRAAEARLAEHLRDNPGVPLADVAHTLQVGRRALPWRSARVARSTEEAVTLLEGRGPGESPRGRAGTSPRPVAFLLPGQGAQYVGMGAALLETHAAFREPLEQCAKLLEPELGVDLRRLLRPEPGQHEAAEALLRETRVCQPVLFAIEYAVAKLLESWGVRPAAMLGHSLGEYVAACLAGVFSLEDALAVVAERGRLMGSMPPGGMMAVALAWEELEPRLDAGLVLAAHNAPQACVVAGPAEPLAALKARLESRGVACSALAVSHAFHSPMMEPAVAPFVERLGRVRLRPPQRPFLSNVTGTWIREEEATSPEYWGRHLARPVRFAEGLARLAELEGALLLEVGPGNTLGRLASRREGTPLTVLPTLGSRREVGSEDERLTGLLGRLWVEGAEVDISALSRGESRQRVPLPTYPFERQRYWVEREASNAPTSAPVAAPTPPPGEGWYYAPEWRRVSLSSTGTGARADRVLLLAGTGEVERAVAAVLEARGHTVLRVEPGEHFEQVSPTHWRVTPGRRRDFERLLEALGEVPPRVLHLWMLGEAEHARERGFDTLLALAQALGMHGAQPTVDISVVADGLHAIMEGEPVLPLKSLVQGPLSVIPQELPGCTCRGIDVVPPAPGAVSLQEWARRLVVEVEAASTEHAVALRASGRWVREYVPLRREPAPVPLREQGVYLITGGLGGVGLTLAEHLARRCSARLVLTGRSPTPPREQWDAWFGTPTRLGLAEERTGLREAAARVEHALPLRCLADREGLEEALRELCASHLYHLLFPREAALERGQHQDVEAVRRRLGMLPSFERLFSFMLGVLEERGWVHRSANGLEGRIAPTDVAGPTMLRERLLSGHPEAASLVELVEHCVRHYPQVLDGSMPALSVLYPTGQSEEPPREEGVEWSSMGQCVALLRHFLARCTERIQGRPLRILEVGGGSGVVLEALRPLLERHPVEYHFTDLGSSFVRAMEETARREGLSFLSTAVLDLDRPPREQDPRTGTYDVVIALNVVHATPSVPRSLKHLEELLAPGGHLCLVETVRQQPWVDMVWGLAEGWWSYEDALRTRSPLLEVDTWERALRDAGFSACEVLPADAHQRSRWDSALFIAERPEGNEARLVEGREAMQERIRRLQAIEAAGGQVVPLVANVTDAERMAEVLAEVKQRFGALHGVIHAALVLEDGLIQLKTPESASRVLASKVEGTLTLDALLRDEPLDFLVLCSSLSSLLGALGQVDYAAASAFLDAYALSKRGLPGRRTVSIDWDRWLEVGAAMRRGLGLAPGRGGALGLRRTAPGVYSARWRAEDAWWLDEHRLGGVATLPGVGYLELVRSTLELEHGQVPLVLEQLVFHAPLTVPDGRQVEVQLHLREDAEGYGLEIRSREWGAEASGWRSHATGQVRVLPREDALPLAPLTEWESRLGPLEAELREESPRNGERAPTLGSRWSTLRWRRAWKGNEGLAAIELAEKHQEDLSQLPLHPALLDAATGFAPLEGAWLPLAYGRLRLHGPLPRRLFSHLRRLEPADGAGVVRYGVRVVDEAGRELLSADEYVLRRVDGSASEPVRRTAVVQPGALDAVRLLPLARRAPAAGEVELQVLASGLTFKDALLALGALPGMVAEGTPLTLGVECAGVVSAVGPGVRDVRVGDAVVAAASGAFSSHVWVPREHVFPKPAGLSFEQAAMVPATLLTAWYAVDTLGRLRAGERILVHAAATGVGLAAVKLALRRGATVYATAGSEAKRDYLRSLGVTLVMDSRGPGFDTQVLEHTRGEGVDVVLNSLRGDFVTRGLSVLAPRGRFIELGVRDMRAGAMLPLAPFERGLTFQAVQVEPSMRGYRELMGEVLQKLEQGELEPLPCTALPLERVGEALRLVASGKHLGKVVLSLEPAASRRDGTPSTPTARPGRLQAGPEAVGLRSEEGCEAFERCLGWGLPQVVVSTRELRARMAEIERLRVSTWEPALPQALRAASATAVRSRPHVEPRNERERGIAAVWRELLGVSEVGLDDDFFELRGDSLLAIQLMGRLRKEFGVELSLAAFLARPTLRALVGEPPPTPAPVDAPVPAPAPAAARPPSENPASTSTRTGPAQARAWTHLVPLQPEGDAPPFFWAAPLLGTVFPYFALARSLAPHPFYALQPPGLEEGQAPVESMEALAALYVREIRQLQPRGPYRLGGWSFGCVAAYEVARQLEAEGEQVALLVLLDFPAPARRTLSGILASARFFSGSVARGLAPYAVEYFDLMARAPREPDGAARLRESLAKGWERMRQGGLLRELWDEASLSRVMPGDSRLLLREPGIAPMVRLARAHQRAMMDYRPTGRLRQRIQLWRTGAHADGFAPDLGWGSLTASGVEIHEATGDHMSLLRPPHVEQVAARLLTLLSAAPTPR
ncbi:beta-ketoacyl synthase N-terminal-like domain-containing protein [Archangium violaceum]|uniref:beta-ketoacyl synthase N-terminal-like domain-containing protein n=1 Tax=Archangium violaceum TaxID=83451 RepID=UPI002B2DCE6D|nr:polyketide synthase [Archangium gephyra]WPB75854.1 beta-ketoacyl synthase N-terminal-like domain-containing protein [Archangium gephyra]